MTRSLAASIVLMVAMVFSSCTCGGGGGDTTVVHNETCGKRFTDLKASLDSGAISQKEYDKMREKIVDECK